MDSGVVEEMVVVVERMEGVGPVQGCRLQWVRCDK